MEGSSCSSWGSSSTQATLPWLGRGLPFLSTQGAFFLIQVLHSSCIFVALDDGLSIAAVAFALVLVPVGEPILLIWKADICTELSCNWSSLWSSRPTRPSGPLVQSLQVWTDPWNPGLTSTILPLKILQVNKRRSQSPPFFLKLAVAYWGLQFGFADHHYSIIMVHKLCLSNSVVEL